MSALLWWSGITLNTPVRDIGLTYVLLAVCVYSFGYLTARLRDAWGHETDSGHR